MTLHSRVPGHPETGSELSPSAGMGAERQHEWEHCCPFSATRSSFQWSSKGSLQGAGLGGTEHPRVEESAEHSPASGVALCSPSFCIVTTMSNSPFDKIDIGKCQGFLPPPWFSVVQGMKMSKDEQGTRTAHAPFKVSDKSPSLLEVWLPLLSKPRVLHIILMLLAVLGFLGNRNGNMDMFQTHTAEYLWLSLGWHETHNLTQSMGAKPVLWGSTEETQINIYENECRSFPQTSIRWDGLCFGSLAAFPKSALARRVPESGQDLQATFLFLEVMKVVFEQCKAFVWSQPGELCSVVKQQMSASETARSATVKTTNYHKPKNPQMAFFRATKY